MDVMGPPKLICYRRISVIADTLSMEKTKRFKDFYTEIQMIIASSLHDFFLFMMVASYLHDFDHFRDGHN